MFDRGSIAEVMERNGKREPYNCALAFGERGNRINESQIAFRGFTEWKSIPILTAI